ncbi:MAG: type IV pilin N-terminal domain-containing protein [Nanoarchaeota archaeon]|nr:type IV pilin N-terminal domain-containing protein [Nanoarchaeota archaeon]
MRIKKRGVSPVVATVLLLLITIIAVSLVAIFVVPFVKKTLTGSEECFGILGSLSFDDSPYNCFVENNRTGFSIRIDSENIIGFKVALFEMGTSNAYEIFNETNLSNIRMLDGNFSELLELPRKGGVRTYVADGVFKRIEINPLLGSGKICGEADNIRINKCLDSDIIRLIESP